MLASEIQGVDIKIGSYDLQGQLHARSMVPGNIHDGASESEGKVEQRLWKRRHDRCLQV